MSAPRLVEHFFRREYGRLLATLARRVGVHHIEAVEDAVQSALMAALETWTVAGLPENPSAWLARVAHNNLVGGLRKRARRSDILKETEPASVDRREVGAEVVFADEVQDDLLRMLFVCCDESIPRESQLVLALKTLCGFDVREIALRLFASEAHVYKRLARARARLRSLELRTDQLRPERYAPRVRGVHKILYLLFTEGYLASRPETTIRRELCEEAIRLATILAAHPLGRTPETAALLALMHLHAARISGRDDGAGGLLLLAEQDRTRWDARQIGIGLEWLARSARGDVFSRYHAEAGIAAEHCLAPSLAQTRWHKVVEYYALLEQFAPSPLHTLGRAVATAQWQGPAAGLVVLERVDPPAWLKASFQWAAVLADLHRRCGHEAEAQRFGAIAEESAPTAAQRALLERRLRSASW